MRHRPLPMPSGLSRTAIFCAALAAAGSLAAQTNLPKESPFARSAETATTPIADEVIEFAGVSSIGDKVDLIFFDKNAKRSRWVSLGETVAGISALSYDAEREQAVVAIHGTRKVLALRKARTVHGESPAGRGIHSPTTAALPQSAVRTPGDAKPVLTVIPEPANAAPTPAGAGPSFTALPGGMASGTQPEAVDPTVASRARAEMEARMLVSDLLEIGVEQRKAYEAAQRKAADADKTAPIH